MALSVALTLTAYALARALARRLPRALANPFLLGTVLLLGGMYAVGLPYPALRAGARPITFLLGPATVALGVPLYRHLGAVRGRVCQVTLAAAAGAAAGALTVLALARLAGLAPEVARSLLPKSVTTPIAVAIAQVVGGRAELAAAFTGLTGFTGSLYATAFLNRLGLRGGFARGLAYGTALHAVGVTLALDEGEEAAALAALGMCLAGLFTALLAPLLAPWMP